MTLTIYALPAALSLLTKVGILFYDRLSRFHNLQTRLFVFFLISFAVLNLAEISIFIEKENDPYSAEGSVRLWFSAAIFAVAFLFHLALVTARSRQRSQTRWIDRAGDLLLYVPTVVLQVLLWGGPSLIVGFEPMGYSVTKIPGPLYFLLELYVVGYLSATIGLFICATRKQLAPYRRLQSKLLLLGFIPLVALVIAILGLQRLGFRGFNAAATLPFTSTFLLVIGAYAIYHYRLLDIAFYVPWSEARKRKSELYKRIRAVAADIANVQSPRDILERIANTLGCRVTLLGGPQPWTAAPRGHVSDSLPAQFPGDALAKIDRTVTADEIADRDPGLHALMSRYQIGAIVPLQSYRTGPRYCLLLDRQFNEEIYSSLDFKVVDRLFSAMAERFFEDFLLVRTQLAEVKEQLHAAERNLMRTEKSVTGMNLKLTAARKQNQSLREALARLRRANFRLVQSEETPFHVLGQKTLDRYLAEREKEALLAALESCGGKKAEAARLLGVPLHTLSYLIVRYRIDTGNDS